MIQPKISGRTRLACLIGDPVEHSGSPALHNAAFEATGIDARYLAFPFAIDQAAEAIEMMRSLRLLGMNVTMPLKQKVSELVDELTPNAEALQSCNCLYWNGEKLVGDSTDGRGFVRAFLSHFPGELAGRSVAIIGAGGAARSIIDALNWTDVGEMSVINRTLSSAQTAANLSERAEVAEAEAVAKADIVINTTSVGMAETQASGVSPVNPKLLTSSQIVVDIIYNPRVTPLLENAEEIGCKTLGGMPMLIHQAALSFEAWTGKDAPIDVMYSAI